MELEIILVSYFFHMNIEKYNLTACVVKIASRCNLNCTYCYIYNKGDDSFKSQPKFLSEKTIIVFFEKLNNYLVGYPFDTFSFVFHGGEPLLAKEDLYDCFISNAQKVLIRHNIQPLFSIQTNGVLVNKAWVKYFKKHKIHVGFSIDGTKSSNENNRIFHNGKSSYESIINGFNTYKDETGITPGILSVIDLEQGPNEVFQHYLDIKADYVNLLFPDDTYDDEFVDDLSLGKWLFALFELWVEKKEIRVDQFEVLLSILYGADFIGDEYYGTRLNNTFILESDGEIQANDPLRVCAPNIHKTKLNVFDDEISDLLKNPLAELYYSSSLKISDKCKSCQLSEICSGGYLINRFNTKNGFDNPSIYCESLAYFIVNVQNRVVEFTNPQLVEEKRVVPFELNEVLNYCRNKNEYEENYELSQFRV